MKLNEPIKPAGIGKGQVAFDVGNKPTALTQSESSANSSDSSQSTEGVRISAITESTALARSIAYSAASSAVANNQNEIWGVRGVADFVVYNVSSTTLGYGFVKFDNTGTKYKYEWQQINNPYMWIDSEDSSKIRVNKSGWYLVDCLVSIENYKNSKNYRLDAITDASEVAILGYDSVHTNDYPTLRINALIPIPAIHTETGETVVEAPYFQIRLGIMDTFNTNTTIQADGYIHAMWMKPFEADESHPTQ